METSSGTDPASESQPQPKNGAAPLFIRSSRQEAGLAPRQLLVRDSIGYLLSKVVPGFFGLVSVPVFVRLIGIGEYGQLAVILPMLMTLTGGAPGWLTQSILRFHPSRRTPESQATLVHAVRVGTTFSVLILGLVLVPVVLAMHYSLVVLAIAELYSITQLIYLVSLSRLQAQLRPGAVLACEALRAFAGFAFPVLTVVLAPQRSFTSLFFGLALGYAPALLLAGAWQSRAIVAADSPSGFHQDWHVTRSTLRLLWSYGWAAGLWLMLVQALPVVGRYTLQHYSGFVQAGIYASLYEVAVRAFSFFAFPVTQAAHPRIMRYWDDGHRSHAQSIIRDSMKYQILMFLPLLVIGVVFAPPLTELILGGRATAPASLLPLLMLGGFLWQIALLVHKPLEIMRRTGILLCGMTLALLTEIVGNWLLVPKLGAQGAAYVFITGALLYICFATLIINRLKFREEAGASQTS